MRVKMKAHTRRLRLFRSSTLPILRSFRRWKKQVDATLAMCWRMDNELSRMTPSHVPDHLAGWPFDQHEQRHQLTPNAPGWLETQTPSAQTCPGLTEDDDQCRLHQSLLEFINIPECYVCLFNRRAAARQSNFVIDWLLMATYPER